MRKKLNLFHLINFCFLSATYESVEENSDILWKFQRYQILSESLDFCILPPPLNFAYYLVILPIKFCFKCLKKSKKTQENEPDDDQEGK